MALTTLIATETLATHIDDASFAIVDCRFRLDDPGWGEREYEAAHIPGALYAHLDHDLSSTPTGTNGRHPLPDPTELQRRLGTFGIAPGVQVVAYDQDTGAFASRLWWLLRWVGHRAVAVLDGGLAKWTAEGRPTRGGIEPRKQADFSGERNRDMMVDAATVAQVTNRRDWRLLDARAPERYRGEVEPIDKKAGHIPTAVNHPFQTNLTAGGTFRSPSELRAQFEASLGSVPPPQIIAYCGSGVTACHNLLAMEHAGLHGAKLYPGSWSEWSADASNPTATGPQP